MIEAKVPLGSHYLVCKECIATITLLDGLVQVTLNGINKTRFEHWLGKLPRFTKKFRKWGEAGVAKTKILKTPKIGDRGVTCMFVGYNTDSSDDVYRMWNPETKCLHHTRDIRWLGRRFYEPNLLNEVREGDNDDDTTSIEEIVDDENEENNIVENENSDSENGNSDIENNDEPDDDDKGEWQKASSCTRSERSVKPPTHLIEEQGVLGFSHAEPFG